MTMPSENDDFERGVDLFNRTHFFDAHEVLEDVWRSIPREWPRHGPRNQPRDRSPRRLLRLHIQGMVQLAVAFHHQFTGNYVGARSVLERAVRNLQGADRSFPDLDLHRLRADLAIWREYLADPLRSSFLRSSEGRTKEGQTDLRHTVPALPKIMRRS